MGWLSQLAITSEAAAAAEELHRRRVLSGSSVTLETTLAEVGFLSAYDRMLSLDDLAPKKNALEFIPVDVEGNRIRIVVWRAFPMLVFSRLLDVDAYVFVVPKQNSLNVAGWLPLEQVEEAPVHWFVQDGKRTGYSHEVSAKFLVEMPAEFLFKETCKHLEDYGGIWDYNEAGWECCGCGRRIYNLEDRERVIRQDQRGGSDQVSP